jgi:hypothetical protein
MNCKVQRVTARRRLDREDQEGMDGAIADLADSLGGVHLQDGERAVECGGRDGRGLKVACGEPPVLLAMQVVHLYAVSIDPTLPGLERAPPYHILLAFADDRIFDRSLDVSPPLDKIELCYILLRADALSPLLLYPIRQVFLYFLRIYAIHPFAVIPSPESTLLARR